MFSAWFGLFFYMRFNKFINIIIMWYSITIIITTINQFRLVLFLAALVRYPTLLLLMCVGLVISNFTIAPLSLTMLSFAIVYMFFLLGGIASIHFLLYVLCNMITLNKKCFPIMSSSTCFYIICLMRQSFIWKMKSIY